jgi:VanZ family protein
VTSHLLLLVVFAVLVSAVFAALTRDAPREQLRTGALMFAAVKAILLWGPVILVMAVIFTASSQPDPGGLPGGMSDKTAHFLGYAALGGSLVRAISGGRPSAMTLRKVLLAALIATLYGASDELHQAFVPGRTPDVLDLVADALGGLAGAAFLTGVARGLPALLTSRPSR